MMLTVSDLDVEELLDRLADLRLVRVLVHLERVAVLRDLTVALLGDDRARSGLRRMEAHASSFLALRAPGRAAARPR